MAKQYTLDDLIEKMVQGAQQANRANLQRYGEAKNIYQDIIGQYQPGGSFLAGAEKTYQRQKQRDMSAAKQGLVSAGLYNTTVQAGLPKKYEEEVGIPYKLNLQDIRSQRVAEAKGELAGLIERREDIAPDYLAMANLVQAAAQGRAAGAGGGGATGIRLGPNASAGLDIFGRPLGTYGGTKDPFGSSSGTGGSSGTMLGGGSGAGSGGSAGGGTYTPGAGGASATDPFAGAKTIWGDPNVYNAEGEIIGSRETEDISDLLGQVKGTKTGWDLGGGGDRFDKLIWDEDRQQYKRVWGGGPKKYGSAEKTTYTSWLTPEEAAEFLQTGLKEQEDISEAPTLDLNEATWNPETNSLEVGGRSIQPGDLYGSFGAVSFGDRKWNINPASGTVGINPSTSWSVRQLLNMKGTGELQRRLPNL